MKYALITFLWYCSIPAMHLEIPELERFSYGSGLELRYQSMLWQDFRIQYALTHEHDPKSAIIKRLTQQVIRKAIVIRDTQLPFEQIGNELEKAQVMVLQDPHELGYIIRGCPQDTYSSSVWEDYWISIKAQIDRETHHTSYLKDIDQ